MTLLLEVKYYTVVFRLTNKIFLVKNTQNISTQLIIFIVVTGAKSHMPNSHFSEICRKQSS